MVYLPLFTYIYHTDQPNEPYMDPMGVCLESFIHTTSRTLEVGADQPPSRHRDDCIFPYILGDLYGKCR